MRFDVLSRHLDVMGTHFLEASAGTGKTFAIEHLVVRLLLEKCPLERILVVTFTRAATRELKTRIYQNIYKAIHRLKQRDPEPGMEDYLQFLREQGETQVQASLRLLEDALICFETASIFTIHSFCHRALSEFAFEGEAPFCLRDPNEGVSLSPVYKVVEEVLRNGVKRPLYSPGQMALLFRHFSRDAERLKTRLVSLAVQEARIQALPSFEDFWKQWLELLQQKFGNEPFCKEEILKLYPKIAWKYKGMTDARFFSQLENWNTMVAKGEGALDQWDRWMTEPQCFWEKIVPENRKIRAKENDFEESHAFQQFEWMRNYLWPILKAARDPNATLLRLGRDCQQYLEQYQKKSTDFFSPDRLLKQMQKSLLSPLFVGRLKQRYQAVIIDEFQDTDPVQWTIFKTLFGSRESGEKSRALCLVGDPKQSIYAFRNADLYTYLEAAQYLGEENRKHLDTNFRSTPALVDALNRLFTSPRTKGWMTLPLLGGILEVPTVRASDRLGEMEDSHRGSVHFFIAKADASKSGTRWPSKKLEQTQLFPFIASEMMNSKEWGRFAVLVKDRYQAQDLWNFLQSLNIPAVICKTESLVSSEAWQGLEELVDAVSHPSDLGKIKKVLIYRWIRWNAEKLLGGMEQPALRRAKQQVLMLRECLFEKGWMAFFHTFLQTRWDSDFTVEETLLMQGDLDLYADLRQISEEIGEILWQKPIGKGDILTFLRELRTEASEQEDQFKRQVRSVQGAVQILTIHMSKGLEFDIVFALGIASRSPLKEGLVIKSEGQEKMVPLDKGCSACAMALEESDAEKMRQLYVALTRAKQRVYIPILLSQNPPSSLGTAAPIELFLSKALQDISLESFIEELGGAIQYSHIDPAQTYLTPVESQNQLFEFSSLHPPPSFRREIPSEWMSSYSALAIASPDPIRFEENTSSISLLNMPVGIETGLIVHRIMEILFDQGIYRMNSLFEIHRCVEKCVSHTPLECWKEVLVEGVADLLKKPFIQGGALCDIPMGSLQSEMEFLFPCDEEYKEKMAKMTQVPMIPSMIKGFIDLVFSFEGKYYLIDWKTNYLGNSQEDYSLEKLYYSIEQQGYLLQAAIYRHALERYVRLFDPRPFEECFGGAFYVYIRGGVLCQV